MQKSYAREVAYGGMIAALYVVLTWVANLAGLASGAVQVRLSEALTILPVFTPAAIPGLTVGCILANFVTGCLPWDIVFGSLATLIGAVGTRLLRKNPWLAWIPPVISNAVIVPAVLMKVYNVEDLTLFGTIFTGSSLYPMLMVSIAIGEIISCGMLGLLLYHSVKRTPLFR